MSTGEICRVGALAIRRLRDDESEYDLLVRWQNAPHVKRFWDPDLPPLTREQAVADYRPDTVEGAPGAACIIELDGVPIGFVQFYRWSSYADEAREARITFDDDSWGLDIYIGEKDLIGQGLGTRAVALVSDHLIAERGASEVSLTTDIVNLAAQRAYEKAGFVKIKEVLDTDTYRGERVRCWFMVKKAPSA